MLEGIPVDEGAVFGGFVADLFCPLDPVGEQRAEDAPAPADCPRGGGGRVGGPPVADAARVTGNAGEDALGNSPVSLVSATSSTILPSSDVGACRQASGQEIHVVPGQIEQRYEPLEPGDQLLDTGCRAGELI